MIQPSTSNHQKLLDLLQQQPQLFQDITKRFEHLKRHSEELYRDDESEVICIGEKIYRFNWEDVEAFGVEEDES